MLNFAPSKRIKMNIESLTTEAVELLSTLVSTPRTSRNETDAANIFAHFIEEKGFPVHREANNVWVVADGYEAARPTLLLNAHLDTVKAVNGWIRNPLVPTLEGDRLYGLGTNDDGASLVALTQAFRMITSKHQAYNLVLLASAEEEVSGHDGIERVLPMLPHIDVALVGEPTGMQPAIAEKGLMVLDITEHGKAGHAAREEGVNALYRAIDDIAWFRTFRFPEESPLLGPVKMSVTIIHAGTQHNVVPDECQFTVDVRSNECYSNHDIFNMVCDAIQGEVKARSFRLNSSHINPSHPLVQRALSLGPTIDGQPRCAFGSPTLSDQALMPWPSMKMGPGNSARSHTADEYICISEIREAIKDYVALLDGLVLM